MRSYYLAHPFDARKEVREKELEIEKRKHISLMNPFYDYGREDITEIDEGRKEKWAVDPEEIVIPDLHRINVADAVVAVLTGGISVGTIMEIAYAKMYGKRVLVIDLLGLRRHPWIRYHADEIFRSWEEFEEVLP